MIRKWIDLPEFVFDLPREQRLAGCAIVRSHLRRSGHVCRCQVLRRRQHWCVGQDSGDITGIEIALLEIAADAVIDDAVRAAITFWRIVSAPSASRITFRIVGRV